MGGKFRKYVQERIITHNICIISLNDDTDDNSLLNRLKKNRFRYFELWGSKLRLNWIEYPI